MTPPTLDQLIRRIVGAAFDAGQAAAARPPADRAKAREDQVTYAVAVLQGHIEAEVARRLREDGGLGVDPRHGGAGCPARELA